VSDRVKGTVARDFTALVFVSKVSRALIHILNFFQIWFQIRSYSSLNFDSPLHYAAGSQKKIVSWESFNT
jgi:hypothetical protein